MASIDYKPTKLNSNHTYFGNYMDFDKYLFFNVVDNLFYIREFCDFDYYACTNVFNYQLYLAEEVK